MIVDVPQPPQLPLMTSTTAMMDESSIAMENLRQQMHNPKIETLITSLSVLVEEENDRSRVHDDAGVLNNRTYVVSSDYDATFVDDLSVQFADTVKILRDNNDDWLYVQVSGDGGRCGYVPRTIVLDLKQFVKQLKEQHYSIIVNDSRHH